MKLLLPLASLLFATASLSGTLLLNNNFDNVDVRTGFGSNAWDGTVGEPFGLAGDTSNTLLGNASGGRNNIRTGGTGAGVGVGGSAAFWGANNEGMLRSRDFGNIYVVSDFSVDFYWDVDTRSGGGGRRTLAGIGWALPAGADGEGTGGGSQDRLYIGVANDETDPTNEFQFSAAGRMNHVGSLIPDSPTLTLTDDSWYTLSFSLVYNGDSTWTATNLNLYLTGADGTDTPSIVGSMPSVTFNPSEGGNLDSATEAYAFALFNRNRGTDRIDNVMVTVPEPATMALLAGLIGLLAVRRRQRG